MIGGEFIGHFIAGLDAEDMIILAVLSLALLAFTFGATRE